MAAPPRPAASVMLTRGDEVLLVRRSPRLKAFANLWAFPGGTLSEGDWGIPVSGAPDAEMATRIAAAVREVFEETGVFLGQGRRPLSVSDRDELRRPCSPARLDSRRSSKASVRKSMPRTSPRSKNS